ncbi:DUF262 domain-containing protein, partial [Salmonella enterica]|nr:DUF262 domain-containing protein [Salmonella enterica]
YERNEVIINPNYQRLFRWDESQKTRFIESLLLGIPIPPIFVFTDESGRWEVIDGLQRLSTIFEFSGVLKKDDGTCHPQFIPSGTRLLPSLDGMKWEKESEDDEKVIPLSIRLDFERSRLRVEILKKESDEKTKYELFERLNTGGSRLTDQEVRNCIMVMLNPELFEKLNKLSQYASFKEVTLQTEKSISEQKPLDLTLRFLAYRYSPFDKSVDINEWLNNISRNIASDKNYNIDAESDLFKRTFDVLAKTTGQNSFKKYDGNNFSRGFLISAYEVITQGIAANIDKYEKQSADYVEEKIKAIWNNPEFTNYARAGVNAPSRLINTLPKAPVWFD